MNPTAKRMKYKQPSLYGKNTYSDTLIKNCGFSPFFFEKIKNCVYGFEKNAIKKENSTNSVTIPIDKNSKNYIKDNRNKENETYEKQIECNINNDIKNISKTDYKSNDDSNYYDPQIHFEYLINNINDNNSESSQIIEAYKSKYKSKFIKIYEANSINFTENNKNKLFHKCCYPGCNRTFSSSGWLKAHFKEHLKQIHNSLFSKLFRIIILNNQVQLMNHLNNNFLGLKIINNENNNSK